MSRGACLEPNRPGLNPCSLFTSSGFKLFIRSSVLPPEEWESRKERTEAHKAFTLSPGHTCFCWGCWYSFTLLIPSHPPGPKASGGTLSQLTSHWTLTATQWEKFDFFSSKGRLRFGKLKWLTQDHPAGELKKSNFNVLSASSPDIHS